MRNTTSTDFRNEQIISRFYDDNIYTISMDQIEIKENQKAEYGSLVCVSENEEVITASTITNNMSCNQNKILFDDKELETLEFIVEMQIKDEINIIDGHILEIRFKNHIKKLNNNIIENEKELDICIDIINEFKTREDALLSKLSRSNNGLRLLMREEEIKQRQANDVLKNIRIKDKIIRQLIEDKQINICRMNNLTNKFEDELKQMKLKLYAPQLECVHISDVSHIYKQELQIELNFADKSNMNDKNHHVLEDNTNNDKDVIGVNNAPYIIDKIEDVNDAPCKFEIICNPADILASSVGHDVLKAVELNEIINNNLSKNNNEEIEGNIVCNKVSSQKDEIEVLKIADISIVLSEDKDAKISLLDDIIEIKIDDKSTFKCIKLNNNMYIKKVNNKKLCDAESSINEYGISINYISSTNMLCNKSMKNKIDNENNASNSNDALVYDSTDGNGNIFNMYWRNSNIKCIVAENETKNILDMKYEKLTLLIHASIFAVAHDETKRSILAQLFIDEVIKLLRKSLSINSSSGNKLLCAYNIYIHNIIILNTYMKILYIQYIMNYIIYSLSECIYYMLTQWCCKVNELNKMLYDKNEASVVKIIFNVSEQHQQQKYHDQHIEMAKCYQPQQQQQHNYHSKHIEMAKRSPILTTPKTSSIYFGALTTSNKIVKKYRENELENGQCIIKCNEYNNKCNNKCNNKIISGLNSMSLVTNCDNINGCMNTKIYCPTHMNSSCYLTEIYGDEYNLISMNCLSEKLGINATTSTPNSNEINLLCINDKSCQHLNINGKLLKVIDIICSANDANLQICNVINIIRITISKEFTLEFDKKILNDALLYGIVCERNEGIIKCDRHGTLIFIAPNTAKHCVRGMGSYIKDDGIESVYDLHLALKLCNKLIIEIKKFDAALNVDNECNLTLSIYVSIFGHDKIKLGILEQLFIDELESIRNNGATILSRMEVQHAAAKIFVELSKSQDIEAGNGITSVCVITCSLLEVAEDFKDLLEKGIHPVALSDVWKLACKKSQIILPDMSCLILLLNKEQLINMNDDKSNKQMIVKLCEVMPVLDATCILSIDYRGIKVIEPNMIVIPLYKFNMQYLNINGENIFAKITLTIEQFRDKVNELQEIFRESLVHNIGSNKYNDDNKCLIDRNLTENDINDNIIRIYHTLNGQGDMVNLMLNDKEQFIVNENKIIIPNTHNNHKINKKLMDINNMKSNHLVTTKTPTLLHTNKETPTLSYTKTIDIKDINIKDINDDNKLKYKQQNHINEIDICNNIIDLMKINYGNNKCVTIVSICGIKSLAIKTECEETPIAKEIKDFAFKVLLIAFVLGIAFVIIGMIKNGNGKFYNLCTILIDIIIVNIVNDNISIINNKNEQKHLDISEQQQEQEYNNPQIEISKRSQDENINIINRNASDNKIDELLEFIENIGEIYVDADKQSYIENEIKQNCDLEIFKFSSFQLCNIMELLAQETNSIKTQIMNVTDTKLVNNECTYDEEQYNSDYYMNKTMDITKYIVIELLKYKLNQNDRIGIIIFDNNNVNATQILRCINDKLFKYDLELNEYSIKFDYELDTLENVFGHVAQSILKVYADKLCRNQLINLALKSDSNILHSHLIQTLIKIICADPGSVLICNKHSSHILSLWIGNNNNRNILGNLLSYQDRQHLLLNLLKQIITYYSSNITLFSSNTIPNLCKITDDSLICEINVGSLKHRVDDFLCSDIIVQIFEAGNLKETQHKHHLSLTMDNSCEMLDLNSNGNSDIHNKDTFEDIMIKYCNIPYMIDPVLPYNNIDVSHVINKPSVACLSISRKSFEGSCRKEIIAFTNMIRLAYRGLEQCYNATINESVQHLPISIFVFRDGVADGQIEQLFTKEVVGIQRAITMLRNKYKLKKWKPKLVKLQYILCNKNTIDRFGLLDQKTGLCRSLNKPCVIYDHILSDRLWDFIAFPYYYKTNVDRTKIVRYIVLFDDLTLSKKCGAVLDLFQFVFSLPYMFAFSIPFPLGGTAQPAPIVYAKHYAESFSQSILSNDKELASLKINKILYLQLAYVFYVFLYCFIFCFLGICLFCPPIYVYILILILRTIIILNTKNMCSGYIVILLFNIL